MAYRSQYEAYLAVLLARGGRQVDYEPHNIKYVKPEQKSNYLPDFYLPEFNFYIEAKGLFSGKDRKKHIWIRDQHPEIDLRFVFQNAYLKLSKRSNTRYCDWADKNGFLWGHKNPPKEWFEKE
ncbi:MAG: putative endonuclease I [Prokaryotic dsDNA virus sp.]|nr:MAG: putative endonuclease I [Prokaryotic dsDNA virus sp.]|tara:strand:+ start:5547 stop:5915 length:369 start_codon:yes stop_codon:yes gene_type:complete